MQKATRTCVFDLSQGVVNVNDHIGLDPHSSYTISEFLEDQRVHEGRKVQYAGRAMLGGLAALKVVFEDGKQFRLVEGDVEIPVEVLRGLGYRLAPNTPAASEDSICAKPA